MIQQEYCTVTVDSNNKYRAKDILKTRYTKHQKSIVSIRRWRWWNYIQFVLAIVAMTEIILFITSSVLLHLAEDPIKFGMKKKNCCVRSPVVFFSNVYAL